MLARVPVTPREVNYTLLDIILFYCSIIHAYSLRLTVEDSNPLACLTRTAFKSNYRTVHELFGRRRMFRWPQDLALS
jgi:hypothetical protein